MRRRVFRGKLGNSYVDQRRKVVWDFGISTNLTLHCWLNSYGGFICIETLLARTLKSKYFADCSVWDATLGHNPSFAWRSILGARNVLELGTRWGIGDGGTVRIWKDSLLGGEGSGKIITPPPNLDSDAKVSDLFEEGQRSWNKDLIKRTFMTIDVDRILSVPLSMNAKADERVWNGKHDCSFKVKEAYKVAMSMNQYASSSSGADPMWKRLWRLNIPPQSQDFLMACRLGHHTP
jgi:hypothetical protein